MTQMNMMNTDNSIKIFTHHTYPRHPRCIFLNTELCI